MANIKTALLRAKVDQKNAELVRRTRMDQTSFNLVLVGIVTVIGSVMVREAGFGIPLWLVVVALLATVGALVWHIQCGRRMLDAFDELLYARRDLFEGIYQERDNSE